MVTTDVNGIPARWKNSQSSYNFENYVIVFWTEQSFSVIKNGVAINYCSNIETVNSENTV